MRDWTAPAVQLSSLAVLAAAAAGLLVPTAATHVAQVERHCGGWEREREWAAPAVHLSSLAVPTAAAVGLLAHAAAASVVAAALTAATSQMAGEARVGEGYQGEHEHGRLPAAALQHHRSSGPGGCRI